MRWPCGFCHIRRRAAHTRNDDPATCVNVRLMARRLNERDARVVADGV
jgi:hypothetical protein